MSDLWTCFPVPTLNEWQQRVCRDLKGTGSWESLCTIDYDQIKRLPLYTSQHIPEDTLHLSPGVPPYLRGYKLDNNWLCSAAYHCSQDVTLTDILTCSPGLDIVELHLPPKANGPAGTTIEFFHSILPEQDITLTGWMLRAVTQPFTALNNLLSALGNSKRSLSSGSVYLDLDPMEIWLSNPEVDPDTLLDEIASQLKTVQTTQQPGISSCLTISSVPYNEAGATPAQELGYILATGSYYLRQLIKAGIPRERIVKNIILKLSVSSDIYTEIAKIRAARLLWSKLLDAFSALPSPSQSKPLAALHLVGSKRDYTLQDKHSNLIRSALQGFAAVVAGCDILTLHPYDILEATDNPDSIHLATAQQLMLRYESRFNRYTDPAGGSYYIDNLTEQLARAGWSTLQKVERAGGIKQCLLKNLIHEWIDESRQRYLSDLTYGNKRKIIGTDCYPAQDKISDLNLKEDRIPGLRTASPRPLPSWRWALPFERLKQRGERLPSSPIILILLDELASTHNSAQQLQNLLTLTALKGSVISYTPSEDPLPLLQSREFPGGIIILCSTLPEASRPPNFEKLLNTLILQAEERNALLFTIGFNHKNITGIDLSHCDRLRLLERILSHLEAIQEEPCCQI